MMRMHELEAGVDRGRRGSRRAPGGAATRQRLRIVVATTLLLLSPMLLSSALPGRVRASSARPRSEAPAVLSSTQNGDSLEVMSFNIRYGTARDGDNVWDLRRSAVIEIIETFRPDVLGVQEALRFQLDELVAVMPRYEEIGVGRTDGIEAGEYAAILVDRSRLKVLEQGTFWFSDTPEVPGSKSWGNDITRICTWVRLRDRTSGRSFYTFNVHWDHQSQPSRVRSAELLMERIGQRAAAADPVLVTGDFNAGESNPAFQYLLGVVAAAPGRSPESGPRGAPDTSHGGERPVRLVDTFRTLHPDATDEGTFNGFEGRTDGDKIDAVLASGEWKVLAAEIVRAAPGGRYPSDHFPVVARVALSRALNLRR